MNENSWKGVGSRRKCGLDSGHTKTGPSALRMPSYLVPSPQPSMSVG